MRKSLQILSAALLLAAPLGAQETFEGTTGGGPLNSYNGYNWNNFYYGDGCSIGANTGYCHGVVSGTQIAYNAFGNNASITNGSTFDFGGAWFTAAFTSDRQLTADPRTNAATGVTITGWLGATQVHQTLFAINFSTPSYFTANWSGIDRLDFQSEPGQGASAQFVMDDISFVAQSTVPEPSSVLLMGIGAAGIALALRRRKQA